MDKINIKENSYSKAYEICKETTIYTSEGRDLTDVDTNYLEDIMPTLYEIVGQIRKIMNESTEKIDRVYITGTAALINNIDLYFEEYLENVKCEILKPGFIRISPEINIKDYVEVNSAISLAISGLGEGITGINFKNKYPKKDACYTLFEKYSKDGIKYELYKNDQLMKDYNSIPETADLEEPTDTKFMMAVPMMFNKSKKYKGRGQSILEKKLDAFDSFDEVWSKWIDALRDNKTITYIPEDLIPTDENGNLLKPNTFDNRYTKTGSTTSETESSKITREKGDFDYEGMLQSYITALDLCLQGLISPSTLGIDVKKLDNADAQREKEKATQYTRGKVIDVLEKVITKLVTICLKTYDLAQKKIAGEYETIVDFKEYANPSFEATVETVSKARPGQNVMSIEKTVDTMYGDSLTKEEKEEEVKRLKEEAGIIEKEEPNIMESLE